MANILYQQNSNDLYMEVREDLLRQKGSILVGQLNNLVRDGIMQIEKTEPVLVTESDSADPLSQKVILRQGVRITFDAEPALEDYRKKVERLSKKFVQLKGVLDDEEEIAS